MALGIRSHRKAVLILFPDDWAPFSPTLLRLADQLAGTFDVKVVCIDTGRFDHSRLDKDVFKPVRLPDWLALSMRKTGLMAFARPAFLALASRNAAGTDATVIAIDGGGAVAATLLGRRFHFLSLEIGRFSPARWLVPRRGLSVSIQSKARLDFQLPGLRSDQIPVVYLQNAPPFEARGAPEDPAPQRNLSRPRLVYLGNVLPAHGLWPMLAMLRAWPEASLTLQGPVSPAVLSKISESSKDLIAEGRLRLSTHYIDDALIPDFLAGFDIGLCLYDLQGSLRKDFNYLSAPSGKMFNYFAAGLPVLGSAIEGLSPVTLHRAGILSEDMSPATLVATGRRIVDQYDDYSCGALRAASTFDFRHAVQELARLLELDSKP